MPHQLPPLNALRIFEVAARTGSYSAAARELNLTHGAVSRQIEKLEAWLGQPLFVRNGQRMVPSQHAQAFAREISTAFDLICDASSRYGKVAANRIVRVNAPATFAMRWLIPRLASFREAHPDVEVRVSTALSTEPGLRGSFDLAIRRDAAATGMYEVTPLFTEGSTVIASPAFLRANPLRDVEDLADQVLLSTETRPSDWEHWLEHAGAPTLRPRQFLRFDHFFVTLQAVIDGVGMAIGTFPTLQIDEEQGRIAMPFPRLRLRGSTYSLLIPRDGDKPTHLRQFLDWLTRTASAA